ncbi:MAG: hypothetical protein ACLQU3_12415 [Limisphaerales bacterium]
MNRPSWIAVVSLVLLASAQAQENLLEDPSFEQPKDKDQFGLVFAKWGGWKYEGDCGFAVGRVAHSGRSSCLLIGRSTPKIRVVQLRDLEPGRYKMTAYIRGLDIGVGVWNQTTEFMFDGKYIPLGKNGTFGWTKLTYVGEIKEKKQAGPSFGLMAPGYFWIDDVTLEKVSGDVPLTEKPVLGVEETAIAPPGELEADAVRCPECGYRNQFSWKNCYACGTALEARKTASSVPALRTITSFEEKNPFEGGTVVQEHATDGAMALRIDKSYAIMDGPQDWTGYDYVKADLYTAAKEPLQLCVEIHDAATKDYWTRVNYNTVVPPGQSTLVLPVKQLYVGEKSRPGRRLLLNAVNRFVLSIGENPVAPLFVDNLRLERDDSAEKVRFDGLYAFDFGTGTSPVMEGFIPVTPGTSYNKGRGYGLKDAKVWRAFDVLQPDPLYQDFICIESGGLAVDVPNGKYRVFVNLDSPSGFWGEYQFYRRRAILAQGKEVAADVMDFDTLKKKYFRFWDVEDLPGDNTFDKYQRGRYQEKTFDVDVTDGQLSLQFSGENWACSVSAVVIYPVAKSAEGERFLKWVEDKRRFYFDNYFKRILHTPKGDPLQPDSTDQRRGYVLFQGDAMKEVYYNDTPLREEIGKPLRLEVFAGQYETATLGLVPLKDLGTVRLAASTLTGLAGKISAEAVDIGLVSYRISRVSMEGSVYTISPRLIMPTNIVAAPQGITRQFWITVKTPRDAKPGMYNGVLTLTSESGAAATVSLEVRVRKGILDPIDIPAGPWGHSIGVPWYEDDPAAAAFSQRLTLASLRKLREYGFTTFSGMPTVHYRGFKDGQPTLDFATADAQMQLAKDLGFLAVCSYGNGVTGLGAYYEDTDEMKAAGFSDYSAFIKAIYSAIQKHADQQGWIPVYWNLADEPLGDDVKRAFENAEAYRKAFPKGPPFFTGASSFTGQNWNDPHFQLSKAFHVANWNLHDEDGVNRLHKSGGDWAFYNGGNRWTFGYYLYKAAKQFDLKFRLSWHWNAVAGDPYYALDCREDDYAWCNATPDGRLVPSIHFEQLRAGIDDYRYLLTLARLANEKSGTPAATAADELIARRLAAFKLGEREHEPLFPPEDWQAFRHKLADAIEALR